MTTTKDAMAIDNHEEGSVAMFRAASSNGASRNQVDYHTQSWGAEASFKMPVGVSGWCGTNVVGAQQL